MLNWGDMLYFVLCDDGCVVCVIDVFGVFEESDFVVCVVNLLKMYMGIVYGVDIEIDKILLMGVGFGGGSFDVVMMLFVLNCLW